MTVIPPITDPLGRYWEQPPVSDILVDDTHAVMTRTTLEKLADYSRSQPTGVYPGKMWRALYYERAIGLDGKVRLTGKTWWQLCWFGDCPDPTRCSNNYRDILLID